MKDSKQSTRPTKFQWVRLTWGLRQSLQTIVKNWWTDAVRQCLTP